MRANGRDIAELFGYQADDLSQDAITASINQACPFSKRTCSKTDHNKTPTGVCSVSQSATPCSSEDVIICPERMYADGYQILRSVASSIWGDSIPFLIGNNLRVRADNSGDCIVALGQRSGKEIQAGNMSMDWVLQRYTPGCIPQDFVGVEVQSIDTTGNYHACRGAYLQLRQGHSISFIPNSEHGLNWANVHKRLIPQLIRKGNLYSKTTGARAFYFLTPDSVFRRFEEVLGKLNDTGAPAPDILSICTFSLSASYTPGKSRAVVPTRQLHYRLSDVAHAFISQLPPNSPSELADALRSALD